MDISTLFIDPSTQKIGIGTNAPQKKFHVEGDMLLTGSIYDSTGEPFSLAGGASWRTPTSAPVLFGPAGVTFTVASNVALQRYSANDLTWNLQTTFVISANTANAAVADYTLKLPIAMNADAYTYSTTVGELWLTAASTNGQLVSSYKAIAKTIPGNKDTLILRYLTGTTDASLVNIAAGFKVTLGGNIMYQTETFVRNPPQDSIFIPTTGVQWISTTYPHPAFQPPAGAMVSVTSNVGSLRYIGDDLIYNVYVQATLGAPPNNAAQTYTLSLQYPLMTEFYPNNAIVGDLWLNVLNGSVSTMYKGIARVYDTSNVALSYLNGTYELGLGTLDSGSVIHLQGNIVYKTSTLATIAIPEEYVPHSLTQDTDGNVAINNGGVPTRGQLDIIHYSNLPALVVDQRGTHANIVEIRKNGSDVKVTVDGDGNIVTSGSIWASNLNVLGDYVTLNTITSNTEQVVVTNAGTGPALKVTQTGIQPIAEFYDYESGLAMTIANNGNIGIGTTVPKYTLDVSGNINFTGSLTSNNAPYLGIGDSIPVGAILPYYSATISDPSYLICDGATYQRADYIELANALGVNPAATTFTVPDLRDKFLKGRSAADAVGATGGSATRTLTEANMPAHSHSGTTTSGEGTHTHTITDPGHQHEIGFDNGSGEGIGTFGTNYQGVAGPYAALDAPGANGRRLLANRTTTGISINSANSAHTHTFTTDTKGSGTAFDILPPYNVVIYVIKAKNNQYITPIREGDYWSFANNKLFYLSGNVGVGTTNPQQLLDVNGNLRVGGEAQLLSGLSIINRNTTSDTYANVGGVRWFDRPALIAGSPITIDPFNGECPYISSSAASQTRAIEIGCTNNGLRETFIAIENNNGLNDKITFNTDFLERMCIINSGSVGIGTNNPQQLLDVNGNLRVGGATIVDGNVGIGTTNPTQKLHVQGNITASGHYLRNNVRKPYARYTTITLPFGPGRLNYNTKAFDTHNAVTTGASWVFTVPSLCQGYYMLHAAIHTSSGGGYMSARINGTTVRIAQDTSGSMINGSTIAYLSSGNTVYFNLDGGVVLDGSSFLAYCEIVCLELCDA